MHSPGAVAFQFGPLVIRWYGILMATSIVVGLWLGHREARRQGLHADDFISIGQWSVLAGLAGARLYEVVFNWDYYGQFPKKIFAVWEGGLGSDGCRTGPGRCSSRSSGSARSGVSSSSRSGWTASGWDRFAWRSWPASRSWWSPSAAWRGRAGAPRSPPRRASLQSPHAAGARRPLSVAHSA